MINPFALPTEAALFDLDGTLIDTHIDFALMRREMLRLAAEHGCDQSDLAGLDILAIVSVCAGRLRASGDHEAANAVRERALDRLREIEIAHCSRPEPIPGAAELLKRLHARGVKIAIVTRNCRDVSEMLVEHGELLHDALVTRDDVERTKPDPEHLAAALRILGLRDDGGSAAIMVGDHWMDIQAGKRARCRTVGLLRGRDPSLFDREEPDTLVDGVADLIPMLESATDLISRRSLFAAAGAAAISDAARPCEAPDLRERAGGEGTPPMDLSGVPCYCTHEHWGSLASFGMTPEGFRADVVRGAVPQRRTGMFDVLVDPYFGGWLAGAGVDIGAVAREAGVQALHSATPDEAARCWRSFRPRLASFELTGAYQALRLGLRSLYVVDIAMAADGDVARLDRRIGEAYGGLYPWYETAMKRAGLVRPIRPVHPEFFWKTDSVGDPAGEDRVFRPIMRIDPLLDLWREPSPRRDALAELTGTEPHDAATWRTFLGALFDRAASQGCVGIKQLQAYSRGLDFAKVADGEVLFRGDLTDAQRRAFQDWVVHECCKIADDRGWPHQIHAGTHNLGQSNPLPLGELAHRYRRMQMVLLHCWPFLTEAGWLAWQNPNVYLDGCWMPVLNPAFLREALGRWLGLMPHTKIMCGQDATSVEMAAGSAQLLREAVGGYLAEAVHRRTITEKTAMTIAHDLLHGNAERLYGA
ncbi:MAG: HAD-IA family hydrolase [Chthonomonadales bacterium]|nr:HAD-IA family hydrolase [Chthonomonadales bacterium]